MWSGLFIPFVFIRFDLALCRIQGKILDIHYFSSKCRLGRTPHGGIGTEDPRNLRRQDTRFTESHPVNSLTQRSSNNSGVQRV